MLEGLQDLVGLFFVLFCFFPKTLANHSLLKFWGFLLVPGMKGSENLPLVYIEGSFQMHCLSVFFR